MCAVLTNPGFILEPNLYGHADGRAEQDFF
jgi:hypothetical protein